MAAMSDIDIILTEAAEAGELAGKRMREAINAIARRASFTDIDPDVLNLLVTELRAAAADAYDAAVDLPVELRQHLHGPEIIPLSTVEQIREIHQAVTHPPIIVNGIDHDVTPDMLAEVERAVRAGNAVVIPDDGPTFTTAGPGTITVNLHAPDTGYLATLQTMADELGDAEDSEPTEEPPATDYGVRITFADQTGMDVHDIESVQVYDSRDGSFPFGFVPIVEQTSDDAPATTAHRAVWWSPEDGEMHTFDARQQPKPNGGW